MKVSKFMFLAVVAMFLSISTSNAQVLKKYKKKPKVIKKDQTTTKSSNNANSQSATLKTKKELADKTIRLSIEFLGAETEIHNGDCTRMQGDISMWILDSNGNRRHYPINRANNRPLHYSGNKSKDFRTRTIMDRNKTSSVNWSRERSKSTATIEVSENAFKNGKLFLEVRPRMDQCHKSCGTCSGYHCDIEYMSGKKKRLIYDYGVDTNIYEMKFNGDKEHKLYTHWRIRRI